MECFRKRGKGNTFRGILFFLAFTGVLFHLAENSHLFSQSNGKRNCYLRPRAQIFPIRTDLGRQITCLFFSSVVFFVSSFCVEFSLQPFFQTWCTRAFDIEEVGNLCYVLSLFFVS